jgi:hypothetical protein
MLIIEILIFFYLETWKTTQFLSSLINFNPSLMSKYALLAQDNQGVGSFSRGDFAGCGKRLADLKIAIDTLFGL